MKPTKKLYGIMEKSLSPSMAIMGIIQQN